MAPTYSREQLIDIYNTQLAAEQAQSAPSVSESPSLLTVPSVAPAPTTTKPKYTRDELINFYNMQTESEPQTLGENLTSAAKQFGAGAAESNLSIAGMLADVMRYNPLSQEGMTNLYQSYQTGDWFPTAKKAQNVAEEYLPAKNDNDNLDRYARTVGEFVGPSALAKVAKPIMGLFGLAKSAPIASEIPSLLKVATSDATMGLGAQAAEDLTGNETIAPIVGAVAASTVPKTLLSAAGAVKQAMFKAGDDSIKATAAQILKEQTGLTADQVDKALAAIPENDLKQFVTTAEATKNPSLSQYQKTLGGIATADGGGADAMVSHQAKREATRNEILDRLTDAQSTEKTTLGTELMKKAEAVKDDRAIVSGQLWNKLDRGEVIDVTDVQTFLKQQIEDKRGYGTRGLDSQVEKVINQMLLGVEPTIVKQSGLPEETINLMLKNKNPTKNITDVPQEIVSEYGKYRSSGALQSMRSELMAISRDANLSAADKDIADSAARAIDSLAQKSFEPENYARWKDARDFTNDSATNLFGRYKPGGDILSANGKPETVTGRIFQNNREYIQNLKRVIDEPSLMDEFKRSVIDSIPRDANDKLTLAKYKGYLKKNEIGLKELFGESHYKDLEVILDDLKSEAIPDNIGFLASKNNSQTSQRQNVGIALVDAISRKVGSGGDTILSRATKGHSANVANENLKNIKKALFEASLDPQLAKMLLKKPTENRIKSVLERLQMLASDGIIDFGKAISINELSNLDVTPQPSSSASILGAYDQQTQAEPSTQSPLLSVPGSQSANFDQNTSGLATGSNQRTQESQGTANTNQEQQYQEIEKAQQKSSQPPVIELRASPPLPMSAQQIMFKPRTNQSFRQSDNESAAGVDETLLDAIRWVESRDGKYTKSPAGALGDYQFMPKTAKAYGVNLYDNDPTDDREGARKLLIDEHGALGEMALAIAAYNAGRPAITRAQAKAEKAGMGSDFVSILPFLPEETQNYVPLVYEAIDRLKSKRV